MVRSDLRQGQVFLGSWTVPRAASSTVVKGQAAEGATTGMREAMIMAQVGPAEYFRPHPCTEGQTGGLPHHVGDHEPSTTASRPCRRSTGRGPRSRS
ncbi:hypothetical protein [Streptomyces sp. NPDC051001]|uniref:hypothetical protein n=1 Tax=Streptomyces sp. NPDC051001 TaxID=3155795 RepID=UPI00342E4841